MYKTVRHGENSLQYTILPQIEEVLNNSGLKGKGRDYSPSIHVRRSRRKSTLKYVVLVIFGIIVALALASVPLYVMNGAFYARRNLQEPHEGESIINTAYVTPTGREIVKSRKKDLKIFPGILSTLKSKIDPSILSTAVLPSASTSALVTNTNRPTTTRNLPHVSVIGAHNDIPLIGTTSSQYEGNTHAFNMLQKSWEKDTIINPTITPEAITIRSIFRYRAYTGSLSTASQDAVPTESGAKFKDVLITTMPSSVSTQTTKTISSTTERSKFNDLKDTLLSVDDDDEFKESLEVDEVFSLPPLKPDFAGPSPESDDVTVSKTSDSAWYGARWPFVDTSSYFQWTGYSPGDNLLLPLLVAALSSVALVLLLALAVRRRKRSYTSSAHIGKLTADLQADDNTNLLTAENAEDAEE